MPLSRHITILTTLLMTLCVSLAMHAERIDGEIINSGIARGKSPLSTLRDSYGFLWVGTQTGLECYDGDGYPVFNAKSSPLRSTLGSKIATIYEQGDNIWFGGTHGLTVFDRLSNTCKEFPHKTEYNVSISSEVQKILTVNKHLIWILTMGQGFFVYDTDNNTLTQNSRNGSFYSDMVVTENGLVFAISLDGYLQRFTCDGNFVNSLRLPGFIADKGHIEMEIVGKYIWIAAGASLYSYDIRTRTIENRPLATLPSDITSMTVTDEHTLLLGTYDGFWAYDTLTGSLERLRLNYQLIDRNITAVEPDTDGNLIVVTQNGGISFIVKDLNDFISVKFGDANDDPIEVCDFSVTDDGTAVICATDKGLLRYNLIDNCFENRTSPLDGVHLTSLCKQDDGVWIGTRHQGLYFREKATGKYRHYTYDESKPYSLISNEINTVYRTSKGEIYVLTNWGLCRYDQQADRFLPIPELDSNIAFLSMHEDGQGQLWASTNNNGLYRKRAGEKFDRFRSVQFGNAAITSMLLSEGTGRFWIVTQSNELLWFDHNAGDFVKLDLPIINKYPITFIEDDFEGNVWVGTVGGLAKIDKDLRIEYFPLRPADDILPVIYPAGSLADNRIIVGYPDGFMIFNPVTIQPGKIPVKAYVQSISFPFAEDTETEVNSLGLNTPLYLRETISIPYSDNTFTLKFTSSRFGSTPPVSFEYMLEGVDKSWMEGDREVTYNNLQPGTYKFRLRTALGSADDQSLLEIKVLPPWYRAWYAYVIYAILAVLLIVLLFWYVRDKYRRRYSESIKEMKMKQERELHKAQMNFFVNLVHENRTPLTLINLQLDELGKNIESSSTPTDADRRRLKSLRRNVSYLLRITNQLLDLRKAEHDSEVRLIKTQVNISRMLTEICQRFEDPLSILGKKIELHLPATDIVSTIDFTKIDRVIMNLIGNAMKYSNTLIDVTLSLSNDGNAVIEIADDGPGIPVEERKRIMEQFAQVEGDVISVGSGTGLGLSYARMVTEAHSGSITVVDNRFGGISLVVTLPDSSAADASSTRVAESLSPENNEDAPENTDDIEEANHTEGRPTVLLVDDNRELLATVSDALSDRYNVLTAIDGRDALEIIRSTVDIDIVVSDFMMPYLDGAGLCRAIKSDIATSHLPFIMLTAKTNLEAKDEGMESGTDAYVEKPFTMKQLILQISNLLKLRQQFYDRMSHNLMTSLTPTDRPAGSADEAQTADEPRINSLDAKFIEEINNLIVDNICDEEFTIDVLADKMGMSRSSFYRKIKAVSGMTPVDYLKNFRLDYAAKKLSEGYRVSEVALMAGFTSSSYFAKCFKSKFGVIPKDYKS